MKAVTFLSQPEQLLLPLDPEAALEAVFERVFRRLRFPQPTPDFRAEYKPFTTLRSTIRLRDHRAEIRVADVLADAPEIVKEALAEILLAQVYRRRPSQESRACYLSYVYRPAVRHRIDEMRRRRGRKRILPPRGRHFDLDEVLDKLNQRYFEGKMERQRIGWSPHRSRSVLGHYDSAHGTIIVSRWFDSAEMPGYMVEYLVFHEMLHIKYPVERDGHRRVVHSRAFRAAEKKFPHYERARRRLMQMARIA